MTQLFEPVGCKVDLQTGAMSDATGDYQKRFRDLEGLYADADAFSAMQAGWSDTVVYEVSEFRPNERSGDLIFGVTRMLPGKVGDEYFVTRGHIHRQADRPEIYYGQKGRGLMLMESPEGEIRIVEIDAQTVCYVPPYWIHRSVNVGDEELVMLFCYPADSGQDYDCIAKAGGMRARIVDDGKGGWKQVDNAGWRMRDAATIAALYGHQEKEKTA
ncbi:MAG TPA: glucose-6-phosphate isomerase [Shinella sp.]|uniref:glucose-6-phosphate isomerase n=1 Tax=Shinella sp. TaxID=1870904 RepID=UPI0029A0E25A|nr:glucose-6-phosphate isomerase [Shinella sp.]MDX3974706.1 glucose-6-phosphate isomerase [Shinella sp.]HEV7246931.1 glucose-6-phosphate isomerase [Shinella sp.]